MPANEERDYSHRSLVEKLGVEPGSRVSVLGIDDPGFFAQLAEVGADVTTRTRKDTDLFFVSVERYADMKKLPPLEGSMVRSGGIWVVYPKGQKNIAQAEIITLGVELGFVDNKVCSFSDTQTALRFVIPKSRR